MHTICTYQIEIEDGFDCTGFNATSPLQVELVGQDAAVTRLHVYADQAALIGLLRHLHQQGFVLMFLRRQVDDGAHASTDQTRAPGRAL